MIHVPGGRAHEASPAAVAPEVGWTAAGIVGAVSGLCTSEIAFEIVTGPITETSDGLHAQQTQLQATIAAEGVTLHRLEQHGTADDPALAAVASLRASDQVALTGIQNSIAGLPATHHGEYVGGGTGIGLAASLAIYSIVAGVQRMRARRRQHATPEASATE